MRNPRGAQGYNPRVSLARFLPWLGAALLAACASTGAEPVVAPAGGPAPAYEFQPALSDLRAALAAREDETAQSLLDRLRARRPPQEIAELLDGFQRVLEGRALVRGLALELVCVEQPRAAGGAARYSVALALTNRGAAEVELHWPPASLLRFTTRIDARGDLTTDTHAQPLRAWPPFALAAGERNERPLGDFEVALGAALAAREHLRLELRGGEAVVAGAAVPLARVAPPSAVVVRLAPFLPNAAVEPAELVRYACQGELRRAALVERAVRTPPQRYGEALDLFAARADELSPEQLALISPALCWLAREAELGADGSGWKQWLARRHNAALERDRPALDLPAAPAPAAGGAPPSRDTSR